MKIYAVIEWYPYEGYDLPMCICKTKHDAEEKIKWIKKQEGWRQGKMEIHEYEI